ncbi:class I SAM-dependent methyltransferase [Phenylobacterium sp.]|uniref:class I SAM-dependent methyltransferase n=1 Tax=Phenylobacterium sp. TaxID=1871053 RepID=UPI002898B210|nr:class I SAM-dependent methyltransferase [Phenylobacterium sp.]
MNAELNAPDLSFDQVDPVYRAFIDDYLRLHGLDPARFCKPLPGQDEMFFKAILPNYEFEASISAFKFVESTIRLGEAYRQLVEGVFGGYRNLGPVLDFASGWGRLTRYLEQRLDPSQIRVADIYHQAIDWQVSTFGVAGTYSDKDPAQLSYAGKHDIVLAGSMFSHLPAGLFHAWLDKLFSLVSDRGLLAFSVHDEAILPIGETMDASGLHFLRFSESGSLDLDIYGMSYVTEDFVGRAIARLGPNLSWRRFPKGLYENQDLYVVGAPGVDLSGLRLGSVPMGGFETLTTLSTGEIEYAGWAIERTPGAAVEAVAVHVDGAEVLTVLPDAERPDVQKHFPGSANAPVGWRFRLAARPGAMVRVELRSTSGLKGHCYAQAPLGASFTYSGWSRRGLR